MLSVVNPFAALANLEAMLVEYMAMQDSPQNTSSSSATASSGAACDPLQGKSSNNPTANMLNGICDDENKETVEFVDNFQCPPSFSWPGISEETLQDDQHPYVLWKH